MSANFNFPLFHIQSLALKIIENDPFSPFPMLNTIEANLADKSNIVSGEGGNIKQGRAMCITNSRKVEGLNTAVASSKKLNFQTYNWYITVWNTHSLKSTIVKTQEPARYVRTRFSNDMQLHTAVASFQII